MTALLNQSRDHVGWKQAGDRTLLFNGWKTAACSLDIDGDGYADEDDLAILIATWSSDNYCHVEPLCDSIETFSQGMSLEEALITLNFTDADDFVEWALNAELESVETTWELLRILVTCC